MEESEYPMVKIECKNKGCDNSFDIPFDAALFMIDVICGKCGYRIGGEQQCNYCEKSIVDSNTEYTGYDWKECMSIFCVYHCSGCIHYENCIDDHGYENKTCKDILLISNQELYQVRNIE